MPTPTSTEVAALERLIDVISPTAAIARGHKERLESALDETAGDEGFGPLWTLKDVVDWETGYFVDGQDTESFVQCVTQIAEAWGATLTFSVDDPLDGAFLRDNTVAELMMRAHAELAPSGLTLWNWATDGDCYSGFISKSDAVPDIASCANDLAVAIRPAAAPF